MLHKIHADPKKKILYTASVWNEAVTDLEGELCLSQGVKLLNLEETELLVEISERVRSSTVAGSSHGVILMT